MNRNIILTVIVLVFFSAWFNSALIHASLNKAPDGYPKSVVATSSTIWVPDNHTTIQKAVNNASQGDTIFVRAGTYYENVVLNKSISLVGENKSTTIIDGRGTGIVVNVKANNITIRGFTIQNGGLGILFSNSSNNIFTGNDVSNKQYGIYLYYSRDNVLTGNDVSNNSYGICLYYSRDNVLAGNTFINNSRYGIYLDGSGYNDLTDNDASNNGYGIYLWGSSNNVLTGNDASNSQYGIYLYYSRDNVFAGNTFTNNSWYGIYLDGSGYNVFAGNTISSNIDDGIRLYHSSNNVLSGNTVSNSQYGIYVSDSHNNVLSGNTASNNSYGIYLYYSRDNVFAGNTFTNNSRSGIRLSPSSNNVIFHNNFINNGEPPSSIDSVNSWDNGAEGNYWSDYDGTDANRDGIGDAPYPIDEGSQDNYPLMAMFIQFNIAKEGRSYKIDTICNSTISNFQYHYDPDNRTNAVSFKVKGTEGRGFCRISVPHALIDPPYTVTVDHNPPSYFKIVYTNGTHTWLYFTYDHSEREVIIMHMSYPEQLVLSQWAILGLTVIIVLLLSISINYYRKFNEQRKVIEAYERELGSFPISHSERARARLIKDVIERKEKIEKFKKKYGIKIQPAGTLEDLMEKLGIKKEG